MTNPSEPDRTFPVSCLCARVPGLAVIGMGSSLHAGAGELSDAVLETFETVKERGQPYWWASLQRCSVCGQRWLVAQEPRQNDVFCLRKLDIQQSIAIENDDQWPSDFDNYEQLLELGSRAGHSVRFVDPLEAGSLNWTVEDLARARPGIRVTEIARLLNLEPRIASILAKRVASATGVAIEFDIGREEDS
jgi:hypothetical protein